MIKTQKIFDFSNKVVLVTGAGKGIGKEVALAFSKSNATVVLTGRHIENIKQVSLTIEDNGKRCIPIKMDVTKEDDIKRTSDIVLKKFKKIDILINNAGINRRIPTVKMNKSDWQEVIDINLTGVFLTSKIFGKSMIENNSGNIINIASISGSRLSRGVSQIAYYSAKAGVIMLTKALAAEWSKYNIRVNSISPGWIKTELVEDEFIKNKEKFKELTNDIPMKRFGEPQEIGEFALFLASEEAKYITGADYIIDGGITLY